MKNGVNVLSLFDGMSCGQIALERAGINVNNYYASEIDKYAIKVTQSNYPNTIQVGDVTKLNAKDFPNVDLIIGGSPCTNFSFAGRKNGMSTKNNIEILNLEYYLELKSNNFEFEGQSYLFWEYMRLLKELKPKYFLLENVNMSKKWQKVLTEAIGVECICINSNLVSAQNRKRLYWTNIANIKQPKDKNINIINIIDENKENYDFYKEYQMKKWFNKEYKYKSTYIVEDINKKSRTLIASSGNTGSDAPKIWYNNVFRFLTVLEHERLQTVPDNYTNCVSKNQRKKMLGNGWTVDVIAHIFKHMK